MATCPQKNCKWRGKARGLTIHLAKVHGIHPQHESFTETKPPWKENVQAASESKVCPVPGCGIQVPDLLSHAELFHPEWFLSNGRFVFEVV